jgi:hypothetical protein
MAGRRETRTFLLVVVALMLVVTPLWAGLRGPGKYSGVVFFDRWGTCMLLSGPYLTYISESVKGNLRPYAGKPIQINASSVFQPSNPGDALVRRFTVIGPAPAPTFIKLEGLHLHLSAAFQTDHSPRFLLSIRNDGPTIKMVVDTADWNHRSSKPQIRLGSIGWAV